jgi:predicted small lipoprotein YifL
MAGRSRVKGVVLLAVLIAVAIAGCGKKGPPSPPGPPDQVIYPKIYPSVP